MSRISIGTDGSRQVTIDLDVLLRTRLLVQASSGGGKSWLLRRLAEQLYGKVPVIIIDPEGEFATLREQFGFVLVGKGGETPADQRSAAIVARRLLELRASAVCDLYEMKPQARHTWVRLFLEALIDAPKKHWGPLVVVVDEAHVFAPEKGQGESEASDAVIGLASRGRKRGFCAVLATQRLGKLSKNAAAELLNVLVGSTFMDVDRKRAVECLGVSPSDQRAFMAELKLLKPGKFWALGRAIATDRTLLTVGPVVTTHPESGSFKHANEPPPTPENIKKLLPQLADLPAEAEKRAATEAELRAEIRALQQAVKTAQAAQPAAERVEVPVLGEKEMRGLEWIAERVEHASESAIKVMEAARDSMQKLTTEAHAAIARVAKPSPVAPVRRMVLDLEAKHAERSTVASENGHIDITPYMRKLLEACARRDPLPITIRQLSLLSGFSRKSSAFDGSVAKLKKSGLVVANGPGSLVLTDQGKDLVGSVAPESTDDRIARWRQSLSKAEANVFDVIVGAYPRSVTREAISEATGYSMASSSFDGSIATLKKAGLATQVGPGELRASEELFS